jgi:hypothetical protein
MSFTTPAPLMPEAVMLMPEAVMPMTEAVTTGRSLLMLGV